MLSKIPFILFFVFAMSASAFAADWKITPIAKAGEIKNSVSLPIVVQCRDGKLVDPAFEKCFGVGDAVDNPRPFKERRNRATKLGGMKDGRVARATDAGAIFEAWYIQPTKRYAHGILGDAIEAGGLAVRTTESKTVKFVLPESMVFEDINPRIVDFEGFGQNRVVTILSQKNNGASLAVFGLDGDKLKLLSQTPYIGRANRWRNVAGIADFDGDGSQQIAEVVTPHIGGTLNFWTWKNDKLILGKSAQGFSNHQIGSREQRLSAVEDFNNDGVMDIAVPNADRTELRLMAFSGAATGEKALNELASIPLPRAVDKAIAAHFNGRSVTFTLGLDDGSAIAIHQ